MMKYFVVPALAFTLVCGFSNSAEARSRGVATYSGNVKTSVSYSSPVKQRSAPDLRCHSTICGKPMAESDTAPMEGVLSSASGMNRQSKVGSRLGTSACTTTFCGRIAR